MLERKEKIIFLTNFPLLHIACKSKLDFIILYNCNCQIALYYKLQYYNNINIKAISVIDINNLNMFYHRGKFFESLLCRRLSMTLHSSSHFGHRIETPVAMNVRSVPLKCALRYGESILK